MNGDKPLADRIALVTGASRGIGAATAVKLAELGAHVIITARTQGGLEEVDDAIREVGGTATLAPMDLTDYDDIDKLGISFILQKSFPIRVWTILCKHVWLA